LICFLFAKGNDFIYNNYLLCPLYPTSTKKENVKIKNKKETTFLQVFDEPSCFL